MPSFLLLLIISLSLTSQQINQSHMATGEAAATRQNEPSQTPDKAGEFKRRVALSAPATPPAIGIIEAQAAGLFMQSETDAPFVVKYFPSQKSELLPGDVAALVEQDAAKPAETVTVAAFFKNAVAVEDWMSDDEKATARKFQTFVETLQTQLENPRVYLFGERERTVVIIGKVKGGFGGVVTLVVET